LGKRGKRARLVGHLSGQPLLIRVFQRPDGHGPCPVFRQGP